MFWRDKIIQIFGVTALVLLIILWNPSVGSPAETDILSSPPTMTIVAVGDILLSRHVGAKIDQADNPNLPFEKVKDILSEANITIGNLECPLSASSVPVREGLVFRCLTEYVPGLLEAGFDVLSTANNHSFDQGEDNLLFTTDYLESQGILPVGTGESLEGKIIERGGTKFGFLAYSYTAKNDGRRSTHPLIATWDDLNRIKKDIENLSKKSDIVIVSIHAGIEYTREPTQEQIDFAHLAIDSGADVIIGHHPHWVQTIEIYKDKPIFYSLGNFVFDQEWSQETKEGLIVNFKFSSYAKASEDKQNIKLEEAQLIPIIIEDFCCPRLADEKEKAEILNKIGREKDIIEF